MFYVYATAVSWGGNDAERVWNNIEEWHNDALLHVF